MNVVMSGVRCVRDGRGRLTAALAAFALLVALPASSGVAEAHEGHPSIAGTVTDAGTGAALEGATATAVNAHGDLAGWTTTDADGSYAISGLSPGAYRVTGTASGYVLVTRQVSVVAEETTTLNLALQPEDGPDDPEPPAPEPDEVCPDDVPAAAFADRDAIPETHRSNVDCAADREIVTGFGDGSYRPGAEVRRDQMASFIARSLTAAGVELPEPRPQRFGDVSADSPHSDAIHRLAAAGIVQGGPGGLAEDDYGPGLGVRRDQMASFLVRAAEFAGVDALGTDAQAFSDVGPGNAHFANVNGAFEAGLAAGVGADAYGPDAGVRRDQMGTFVIRLLVFLAEQPAEA